MGGQFSKKKAVDTPPALKMNANSEFTSDLCSYETACKLDAELELFDTTVHERTNRVINTLATGVEIRSLSLDSLKEVTDCLLEMNQEVVNVILECKEDIWKNKGWFDLVKEYFDSSLQTLEFCTTLENCLRRVRDNQLILKVAVQHCEEEVKNEVEGRKFVKTLQELKQFKATGDPFTEEFFAMFQVVHEQQVSILGKLQLRKRKLDKKMKKLKMWRRVSNVIFVATFVSVLIFSVVAAAIAAPPFVTALAGALAVPIGSVGKWCNSFWKGYENALKGQKEVITLMQLRTLITMTDLDNIRVLVNKFEIEIDSMLQNADLALREEDAVKLVIDEIKKRLEVFTETIEVLGQHAAKCSQNITKARTLILQRIIRQPN